MKLRIPRARRPRLYELRLGAMAWAAHWPAHLSWAAHLDRWCACVDRARAFLRGELADPCHAEHFGAKHGVDLDRANRAGWVLAACSRGTSNAFWRLR